MVRLNDMLPIDDPGRPGRRSCRRCATAPRSRARRCPDAARSTPTTGRSPTSATWREYLEVKPELGVPSLYYATHLDLTGEALDEEDYAALRRVWGLA